METFVRWWRGRSRARKWFIGSVYVADAVVFVVFLGIGAYAVATVLALGTVGQLAVVLWGFARWGEHGPPPCS